VTPRTIVARLLTALEAGMGFAFLALVIGYIPLISQAFSRREVSISMLDARAGSPPTAAQLLCRHGDEGGDDLLDLLRNWERWSAELLESHISFPVLSYFRSQHDNQSWVAALTTVLDVCALIVARIDERPVTPGSASTPPSSSAQIGRRASRRSRAPASAGPLPLGLALVGVDDRLHEAREALLQLVAAGGVVHLDALTLRTGRSRIQPPACPGR
jgi:hypothetical protein